MKLFGPQKQFNTKSVIYKITCTANNKTYVGSTISFRKRMQKHKNELKGKRHYSVLLQECYNKYGADAFEVEILEEFDKNIPFLSKDYKEVLLKQESY